MGWGGVIQCRNSRSLHVAWGKTKRQTFLRTRPKLCFGCFTRCLWRIELCRQKVAFSGQLVQEMVIIRLCVSPVLKQLRLQQASNSGAHSSRHRPQSNWCWEIDSSPRSLRSQPNPQRLRETANPLESYNCQNSPHLFIPRWVFVLMRGTERHRDRMTDGQQERETERHRDKMTDRQQERERSGADTAITFNDRCLHSLHQCCTSSLMMGLLRSKVAAPSQTISRISPPPPSLSLSSP